MTLRPKSTGDVRRLPPAFGVREVENGDPEGIGWSPMANLDDAGEEGVSLFPMFNILACTLGVMVFILATVATV
ncbi:MAG: hypothetical protein O2958_10325 [Gemmatimonadetes bacterium]|nr:hypothetical protein [Gemmatimonadota bacterium]MDA1103394.1 hypothetical protein [Gemmatimonadota bacterium]